MKKLCVFLTCLLFAGLQLVQAQNVRITGTVTGSEDGMPLPGVSVIVKGASTAVGTATNIDGKFDLSVPAGATALEFSFIGYETQTVEIAGRSVIDVTLASSSEQIEEVMVVAYGVVKREAKTGSVSTVGSESISTAPVTSVDKMLSGKMAGVQVTAATGQPGANSQIRIRGISSINAGSDPLWVVDGIPVMSGDQGYFTNSSNTMNAVNPNDIESITVLKDAAAASIYGSRAANGVIIVTTKSGKSGDAKFQARAKYGVSRLANDNDYGVMSGAELLDFQRTAYSNAGYTEAEIDVLRPMSLLDGPLTDWMDFFTRSGKMQEYELNASAGNDRGKFYTSLLYHKNEGIYYGIQLEKFSGRINTDYKLKKNLEVGARVNIAYTNSDDVAMQSLYYDNPAFAGMTILPWTTPYLTDGSYNLNIPENSSTNPRATAAYDDQWEKQYRTQSTYYLAWKPIEKLELKSNNSLETTFGEGRRYWDPRAHKSYQEDNIGVLQASQLQYVRLTTSNTATYNDVFADKHYVRALLGQEAMQERYHSYYLYSPDVDPLIPYPSTSTAETDEGGYSYSAETLLSYFGMLDYNYDAKYYFQGSLRYDGSSLFGDDTQWGLFWSLGASWNIHKESFMENLSMIDMLKLRVSYGVNGNNSISPYKAYGAYAATAYSGITGMLPSTPSNSKLSWETNYTWNGGLDFGVLNNRINGSFDIYSRETKDMLLSKQVPQTSGFSSNFMNIGSLKNNGWEFQLNGEILRTNDFSWTAGFNISHNKTELLDLGDVDEMAYSGDSRLRHVVGESMYTFYLKDYYGVNPSNGEALWRTETGEITNNYNNARYVYAGSPEPKYTGGFNTAVNWKGLDLSIFLEFKQGNDVLIIENRYLNADGNQMSMNQVKSASNYWKKPGDTGCNPKPVAKNSSSSYTFANTRWLEDGSFCRIKDITLSYTLPENFAKMVKLGGAKVYVSALNLYTFHDVNFWDPERGVTGMGVGIYPMTKTIVGGIELSF